MLNEMHVKMNIIAKISCYFKRSVVTLKLRKQYLSTVTYNTPVLLPIKYWTVSYLERYSMSTKTVRFFWLTLYIRRPIHLYYVTSSSLLNHSMLLNSLNYRQGDLFIIGLWFSRGLGPWKFLGGGPPRSPGSDAPGKEWMNTIYVDREPTLKDACWTLSAPIRKMLNSKYPGVLLKINNTQTM